MCERDWNAMDEAAFDDVLRRSLDDAPPEDVVRRVTPFRRAMTCILAGLALDMLRLNFLCLQYLLPAAGTVLMLLGFRALRRENGCFRVCWILTLLRTAYQLPALMLNATVYQEAAYSLPVFTVLSWMSGAAALVLLLCFWRGMRTLQRSAGLPMHARGAAALAVWYVLICVLALVQYSGIVIGIVILFAYGCILRSLYVLMREVDEAGYAIRTAPVRLPDGALAGVITAVLVIGIGCGYLFFGKYDMAWAPAEESADAETAEIRAHLLSLGFPAEVLADLSDEDIQACSGALRVVAAVQEHPVNDGRTVTERTGDGLSVHTEYDVKELRITGVAVELPGERESWEIFHHFLWTVNPGFAGTEAMQLWPTDRLAGWRIDGEWSGRVLCTLDGQEMVSPYDSLGSETYESDTVLWGRQTSDAVFAAFSFPRAAERCRGYVSYRVLELQDGWIVDSWVNYVHQSSWMQYPVETAAGWRMQTSMTSRGAFRVVQDALQFYPPEPDAKPFGAE
ncbi:MAG: hypothetical protein ACI3XP_02530 [Eubacteriales bacterium]